MFKLNISYKQYCYIFTGLSFLVANLGLKQIISLSVPVLMFIYPISIVLISLSILSIYMGKRMRVYQITLGVTSLFALLDFIKALPDPVKNIEFLKAILTFGENTLPGFKIGFAWIIPALLAFVISYLIDRKYIRN